jgi:hypothetical protein
MIDKDYPAEYGRRRAEAVKIRLENITEIAALKVALSELAALLIEKKVLSKQDVVSHFLEAADQIMRTTTSAGAGTKVFEQIANHVLTATKDD